MKELKALNKRTAPKSVMPEKIIQFGEGNFLRAFVDWIIWNMDQKTDFNGSVVVVQPIERGMVDWLNGQDCLYHVNLQGRLNGEAVNSLERIDVISRAINPYSQNWAYMMRTCKPAFSAGNSARSSSHVMFSAFSITQRWKISACTTRLSL